MMHRKICSKLCRLCGKEKQRGTDVFKDKVKGAVLCSIISKYFPKEVITIGIGDTLTKYVCTDCEEKICTFDEFCLTVANVQKQLSTPLLEIDFAEDMLRHLKENEVTEKSAGGWNGRAKNVTCQLCAKCFRCQAHLDRHKIIHTGQRPFACDICPMSFNQRDVLNKHKERHQGKKSFRCGNCQLSFRFKVSLKSHMINFHSAESENSSKTKEQGHTCNDCGKEFATRYKLERHSRSHTGERPYVCNYCNRNFSQSGNLKSHIFKCQGGGSLLMSGAIAAVDELQIAPNLDFPESQPAAAIDPPPSCSNALQTQSASLAHFQPTMYITDSEIQKTINETIATASSPVVDNNHPTYLMKSYENPIYIDNDMEILLDRDLNIEDESGKFSTNNAHDKMSMCLKQPETPELLHSLLYDD